MSDEMTDFLDFGDDDDDNNKNEDVFGDEYANLNRCEGTPSSEDVDLNPLENSISALSTASQTGVDLEMNDFAIAASLGSSWANVNDSFSQLHVKAEPVDKGSALFDDAIAIPGSWPTARKPVSAAAMRNRVPVTQNPQLLHPTSFTMSQIAPPSLPQERSSSTTATTSLCSEVIKEEERGSTTHVSELTEPAKKRRASETVRKVAVPAKTCHKRSNSNASISTLVTQEPAPALPVGLELDESGDPIVAKRQDRLMRNRAAALASRERKREHVMRLESSVTDLETDRTGLQKQVISMYEEITRLRKVLADNNIEDKAAVEFKLPLIGNNSMPEPETSISTAPQAAEHAAVSRTKAAPTGFSPRGALKKSEIIANQIRAEEHLRNVTMAHTGIRPAIRSSNKAAVPKDVTKNRSNENENVSKASPVTIERHGKSSGSGGSVVFMILIFGIALFANTNNSGALNLTGFSRDPSSPGLLLDLPQNFGEICPETVISRLRGQGFMLSEEIGDLEARSLLIADKRASSVSSTTSTTPVLEGDIPNWVTTNHGGDLPHEVGKTFTIATPRVSSLEQSSSSTEHGVDTYLQQQHQQQSLRQQQHDSNDTKKWTILGCEIKRVQDLDDMMTH